MSLRMIRALMLKDLRLFFANRFFALVTVLGLVAYPVIYLLMPDRVDETLTIGVAGWQLPPALLSDLSAEGVVLQPFADADALRSAVSTSDLGVGFVLPADTGQLIASGSTIPATLYVSGALPAEYRQLYQVFFNEIVAILSSRNLPLEVQREMLGPDMAGAQITPRQRVQPALAVLVLMVECLGLAGLISAEIESGTLRALLTTPLTVRAVLVAKGLFGTLFAFAQALLISMLTGGLNREPTLALAALAGGALLVTAVAFVVGALGRDLLAVLGWGTLALIVLALPLTDLAVPGLTADWVQLIPSYPLVTAIYRSSVFGEGWAELGPHVAALIASASVGFLIGGLLLQRRFR